jgi:hypothetical protein
MLGACLLAALGCEALLGYDDVTFDAGGSAAGGSATGGASGAGGSATGGSATGGSAAGGASGAGGSADGGSSGSADPFEQARQTCIDHINQLRASIGLPAYTRWTSAETCVDQQATDDEQTGLAHNAWKTKKFACDGYGAAQNECLGGGATGIVGCLNMMWAEKDLPGCAGCDACTGSGGCDNCDFYGTQTGDVCGHYVNMSAKWFSMAACGFSTQGGWAAINFQ